MKLVIKPVPQEQCSCKKIKIETFGNDSEYNGKIFAEWLYVNTSKAFAETFLLTFFHLLIEKKPNSLSKEIEEIVQFMVEKEI